MGSGLNVVQFTAELLVSSEQQELLRTVQRGLLEWTPYSTFLQPRGGGDWGLLVIYSSELDAEGLRALARQAGINPDAWQFGDQEMV